MRGEVTKLKGEKLKELLKSLGFNETNCNNCVMFQRDEANPFKGTCNHLVSLASKLKRKQGDYGNQPLFPQITFVLDGEEVTIPGIAADAFGVNAGLVKWPEFYDPLYILICMFYTSEADKQILDQENSVVDKPDD